MALRALGSAFLFCALLGGCTLGSDAPLVARGDIVPGLTDGTYQRYVLTHMPKSRDLPAELRRDCIRPGYVFQIPDEAGKPRNRRISPSYCPYDGAQRLPLVRIARDGDGYRLTEAERGLTIRFARLRDGIYLVQSDDPASEGLRYGYALSREAPGGIDLALLFCDYFPALKSIRETAVSNAIEAPDAGPEPEPVADPSPEPEMADAPAEILPGQRGDCRAPSLEAIRPQLDAVVDRMARGREPVWILLRRVPGR